VLVPVHTADGGHTWTVVTPAQAKPVLVPDRSSDVLLAPSASRAWLAVTLTRSEAGYGTRSALTEVFGTADGGRSWTRPAPVHAPGVARWLAFSDPAHGWLLQDLGAAMGNNPVRLYRTSDGGRHWLLIAASPRWNQAGTGPGTLPSACDKTGIGFATPTDGWLTGTWIRVQPARARCRACRVTNLLLPAAHRPGDPPCHRERCEGPIFLRPGGTRWTSTTRTGSCAEWPARPGSPSPSARTLHHAFLTLCVTKRHPCAQADLPVVTEHGQRSKSSTALHRRSVRTLAQMRP